MYILISFAHLQIHIHTLNEKSYCWSSDKTFGTSSYKKEKCPKLFWWVNFIFHWELLVALHLELCCFIWCNNSYALGTKSLRHRDDQAILKNSSLIAEWKTFCGILLSIWSINTTENRDEFLLSNNLYRKVLSLMIISN